MSKQCYLNRFASISSDCFLCTRHNQFNVYTHTLFQLIDTSIHVTFKLCNIYRSFKSHDNGNRRIIDDVVIITYWFICVVSCAVWYNTFHISFVMGCTVICDLKLQVIYVTFSVYSNFEYYSMLFYFFLIILNKL